MIKIKVTKTKVIEPTELPPPGLRENTAIQHEGTPTAPLPVYIHQQALAEMAVRAVNVGRYEVGGFLIGGLHTHDGKRYVDIRNHIPSLQAESATAHLTFTNQAQRECYLTKDKLYPDEQVLGWYHTHPGYGVFLSGYDLFLHKQYFKLDWHIAVVIDPTARPPRRDAGVFVWQGDQVSRPYGMTVYR